MTKKKPPTIPIDASVHQQMTAYATEHGLSLSDLAARMWHLWLAIDQAHETLFPHQLADGQSSDLDAFLEEMQAQSDAIYTWRDRQSGRFMEPEEKAMQDLRAFLNDTEIEQH